MNNAHSDLEQCTESKLGWVHQVHTLNPACAPTAPRSRAQRALGAVSWHQGAVSQAQHRPCCKPPRPYRGRVAAHTLALLRAVSQPCRSRIAGRVATHPRSQASVCHYTTDCIVTHSPAARPLSPVTIQNFVSQHSPPARSRVRELSAVSWPPLAVSQPGHGRIVSVAGRVVALAAAPRTAVSRYNSLYRDSNGQ